MNDPSPDLDDVLEQVRAAHRICAGFYQRVFPLINDAAKSLRLTFETWNPRASKLANKRGNPLERWAWDNLPMVNARFAFVTTTDPQIGEEDYLLDIQLVTDSLLKKEKRAKVPPTPDGRGPDATLVAESQLRSETRLDIYVFLPRLLIPDRALVEACRRGACRGYPDAEPREDPQFVDWCDGTFLVGMQAVPFKHLMDAGGTQELVKRISNLRENTVARRGPWQTDQVDVGDEDADAGRT